MATVERDAMRWPDAVDSLPISVGKGVVQSGLRLDARRESRLSESSRFDLVLDELCEQARSLDDSPIVIDGRAGIAVSGDSADSAAIARALVVQLTRLLSPRNFEIHMPSDSGWHWMQCLPHRIRIGDPLRSTETLRIDFVSTGPASELSPIATVAVVSEKHHVPRGFITIGARRVGSGQSERTLSDGVSEQVLLPDYCTVAEATAYAETLLIEAQREQVMPSGAHLPTQVVFDHDAVVVRSNDAARDSEIWTTLEGSLGMSESGAWNIDLVGEGPHAVIGGTTGSGKSELMVTWILALASRYPPSAVSFLLVDFKGGSAFSQIAELTHTVGLLSDLDAGSAKRAIESLSAEIRFRERHLLEVQARSIDQLPAESRLARLVIVVDEFAVLARELPELREVFVDLAARGRSLGVHLVLCTQRPAEVMRDAILANVTVRISLRVNDRASSIALLGTALAAELPRAAPGRAAVSIAGEVPRLIQAAIANEEDIRKVSLLWPGASRARRPWCDPLPQEVLSNYPGVREANAFALGDFPAEQAQDPVSWSPGRDGHVLVQGARRSGRSTALAALAKSIPVTEILNVASGGQFATERAWDVVSELVAELGATSSPRARIVVFDDFDDLVSEFGPDHQTAFVDMVDRLMRAGITNGIGIAMSIQRSSSLLARAVSSCDQRLLLRMPSRHDHLLAQGRSEDFDDRMVPGGGWWAGSRVQVVNVQLLGTETTVSARGVVSLHPSIATGPPQIMALVTSLPAQVSRTLASTHRVIDVRDAAALRDALGHVHTGRTPRSDSDVWAFVGDVDGWHGAHLALAQVRAHIPIMMHDCSAAEFRAITRSKTHPPPLAHTHGRAWLLHPDGRIERAQLPLER